MASISKRLITLAGTAGAASALLVAPGSATAQAAPTTTAITAFVAQQANHAQSQAARPNAATTTTSAKRCLELLRPWGRYEGGKWRMYGTVRAHCKSKGGWWWMALQKKTKIAGITHWKRLAGRTLRSDQTGAFHVRATCKSMKKNTFRVVTSGGKVLIGPSLTVKC
ncbi:hypothetical protein Sru01_30820 [Sphaerisporangium rufum]|uniref:Uncharacterized protein n=1 Tax=Sphaerisporangium rufum TaxID=1381558 RepID=A0A919R4C0_9ACTN|nr:hypothetical protein [Sphaerisporangium rufum]GII78100.1 hypothetical protein Sru01_30820 [Sphaerisporangium rufum]